MVRLWRASGFGPVRVAALVVLWFAPVILLAWFRAPNYVYRTPLDVYGLVLQSPLVLLMPLVVAAIAVSSLFTELGHRFAFSIVTRTGRSAYVLGHAWISALTSFVVFFFVAFIPFVVVFYLWPLLGSPGLTGRLRGVDVTKDSTYSQLLAFGPLPFGLVYSTVLGLAAAAYALLVVGSLLTVANRYLAVLVPAGFSLIATIAASLIGQPGLGPAYAAVPFELAQRPIPYALAPILVLLAAGVAWVLWSSRRDAASSIR